MINRTSPLIFCIIGLLVAGASNVFSASHLEVKTGPPIWSYTIVNDNAPNSGQFVTFFSMDVNARVKIVGKPEGWECSTDNSTNIQCYNNDPEGQPPVHDVPPGQTLGGFKVFALTLKSGFGRNALSEWDHTKNMPGAPIEGSALLVPGGGQPNPIEKKMEPMTFGALLQDGKVEEAKQWLVQHPDLQKQLTPDNLSGALNTAYIYGQPESAKYLISLGADVNAKFGVHPLINAGILHDPRDTRVGHIDTTKTDKVLELLLAAGANPDGTGTTPPLLDAAAGGEANKVNLLLDHGANIHLKDVTGNTALHEAAVSGSIPIARALLSKGLKINETDKAGETVLAIAAGGCYTDFMRYLISKGANPKLVSDGGYGVLRVIQEQEKPTYVNADGGHTGCAKELREIYNLRPGSPYKERVSH